MKKVFLLVFFKNILVIIFAIILVIILLKNRQFVELSREKKVKKRCKSVKKAIDNLLSLSKEKKLKKKIYKLVKKGN